jgi:hypothetical protein
MNIIKVVVIVGIPSLAFILDGNCQNKIKKLINVIIENTNDHFELILLFCVDN